MAAANEWDSVLQEQPRGVLLLADAIDSTVLHKARVPVEVSLAPLALADLRIRSRWLASRAPLTRSGADLDAIESERLAHLGRIAAHEIASVLCYTATNVEYLREAILEWRAEEAEVGLVARESELRIFQGVGPGGRTLAIPDNDILRRFRLPLQGAVCLFLAKAGLSLQTRTGTARD